MHICLKRMISAFHYHAEYIKFVCGLVSSSHSSYLIEILTSCNVKPSDLSLSYCIIVSEDYSGTTVLSLLCEYS